MLFSVAVIPTTPPPTTQPPLCPEFFFPMLSGENVTTCVPCDCDRNGSESCNATGACRCRNQFAGPRCDACAEGFFTNTTFPDCVPCLCNSFGTASCNNNNGECTCRGNFVGERCDRCAPFTFLTFTPVTSPYILQCAPCNCSMEGSLGCNRFSGACQCRPLVTGERCDSCISNHFPAGGSLEQCSLCPCDVNATETCTLSGELS